MKNKYKKTDSPIYDLRLFYGILENDKSLNSFLKWIQKIPLFSVWLFNYRWEADPLLLSLDEHNIRANRLSKVIVMIHEINSKINTGIDVVYTQGHGDKKSNIREFGFQPIVGLDGSEAPGVCPLDTKFLQYVYDMYKIYAKTGADQIWPDDDIRIKWHGQNSVYCFCPLHLNKISNITGKKWSIEELNRTLLDPKEKEIINIWRKINIDSIVNIQEQIEKAVHEVNKNIKIGLMPCNANEGRDIDKELAALKGIGPDPIIRPGAFYYQDDDLRGAIKKRIRIRSDKPFEFTNFEETYELENLPYWPSLKSIQAARLEMDMAILDGSDRISFDLFGDWENIYKSNKKANKYEKLLNNRNNFLLSLKESILDKSKLGVNVLRNKDYEKNNGFKKISESLSRIGVPTVSYLNSISPTVMTDQVCEEIDDSKLLEILDKGAIFEKDSFQSLIRRKIIDKKDINILDKIIDRTNIGYEQYTDNYMNGKYRREKLISCIFCLLPQYVIEIKNKEKFSILSEWVDTEGNALGPSLIIYNNKIPSLIFPFNFSENIDNQWEYLDFSNINLLSEEKIHQIGCFLSMLPNYKGVMVKDFNKFPILYKNSNVIILGIVNFSLDESHGIDIWLSNIIGSPKTRVEFLNEFGNWVTVDYKLQKEVDFLSGFSLLIKKNLKPMSTEVFRWHI